MYICYIYFSRELRDFRQRYDALAMDVKRKEIQIRDLQTRLESGDGCEYLLLYT